MATFKVIGKGQDGKYFDDMALNDVISYITQPQKTTHGFIGGYGVQPEYAAQQMEYVSRAYHNYDKVRLRHFIISFGEKDYITLNEAFFISQKAAEFFADRYQIVFAVHEDTRHIHVHFVMNQVSYVDGKKYSGKCKEHYNFIYYMKEVCEDFGIDFIPVSD